MDLKKKFYTVLEKTIKVLKVKNVILLEIEPTRSDNTEPLVNEILKRNNINNYAIIIVSSNPKGLDYLKQERVHIIKRPETKRQVVDRVIMTIARARAVFIGDVTYPIAKLGEETVRVYLTHGSPLKSVKKYLAAPKDTDYMLNQSPFWTEINSRELHISEDKLITLGYPRNDYLLSKNLNLRKVFGHDYNAVIAWYPTFRHHINSSYREGVAIPLIHNIENLRSIQVIAKQNNVLIVIKPHPYQDISTVNQSEFENIKFITDDFFAIHKMRPYEFLGATDAMITDYSSVFFDYLITKKPIALTFEDYELYAQHNGFAINTDIIKECSEMLEEPHDFERFFKNILRGEDPYYEKRIKVMHKTNYYCDNHSSERFVDWMAKILLQNSKISA